MHGVLSDRGDRDVGHFMGLFSQPLFFNQIFSKVHSEILCRSMLIFEKQIPFLQRTLSLQHEEFSISNCQDLEEVSYVAAGIKQGRANLVKTSLLQRLCSLTGSQVSLLTFGCVVSSNTCF